MSFSQFSSWTAACWFSWCLQRNALRETQEELHPAYTAAWWPPPPPWTAPPASSCSHKEINNNMSLNGRSSLWFVKYVSHELRVVMISVKTSEQPVLHVCGVYECTRASKSHLRRTRKTLFSVIFPSVLYRFVSYCMVALKTLCTASSRSSGETWASRSSNIFNCFLYSTNMASSSPWEKKTACTLD